MNPRFHCGGENIKILHNEVIGDDVIHVCLCTKCGEGFAIKQTVEQWKRD